MATYFAVMCGAGPGWDRSRKRTDQDGWPEHALDVFVSRGGIGLRS
jgi:hypothetical protein